MFPNKRLKKMLVKKIKRGKNMEYFGIELDIEKNKIRSSKLREINTEKAKTKVLVIPTNEELEIARQSFEFIK